MEVKTMAKKKVIAGTSGEYMGKFKGSSMWHRIPASTMAKAKQKMLKNTRYKPSEVTIKKYKR